MKKILSNSLIFIITIAVLSMIILPVGAESSNIWISKVDEHGEVYLYNTETKMSIVESYQYDSEENLVPIDLLEYLDVLNAETHSVEDTVDGDDESSLINPYIIPTYTYKERFVKTSTKNEYRTPVAVSATVRGATGAYVFVSESRTFTESFTLHTSVTASTQKSLIRATASGTWNVSASNSASGGGIFAVPPGKLGYITFSPKYTVISGSLYRDKLIAANWQFVSTEYLGTSKGSYPVKLGNGLAEGIYSLVLYNQ